MNPKLSSIYLQAAHASLSSELGHTEMGRVHSYIVNNRFEESESLLATFRDPIAEVFSEQIEGRENNKLPSPYYGHQRNNPMLMATQMVFNDNGGGKTEKAAVSIRTRYVGTNEKPLLIGARVVDKWGKPTSEILDSIPASKDMTKKNKFNFPVKDGSKLYEIVAGMDINGNGKLESNEVSCRFYGTHAKGTVKDAESYVGAQWILHSKDKIRIFTRNDILEAREKTLAMANSRLAKKHTNAASALLGQAFVEGKGTLTVEYSLSPNDIIPSVNVQVSSDDSRLTHPLGGNWDMSNRETVKKYQFSSTTQLATSFLKSDTMKDFLIKAITDNSALFRVSGNKGDVREIPFPINGSIDFSAKDNKKDLHVAIGNCMFTGTLNVKFKILDISSSNNLASKIKVLEVQVTGVADDLYDFNYYTKEIKHPLLTAETQSPTRLQAGFASLASELGYPDMGKIFFTEVQIDGKQKDIDLTLEP